MLSLLFAASPAIGGGDERCPFPLNESLRLMLVTAQTMDTQSARLQYFTRSTTRSNWKPVGVSELAVIGKAGLAWGSTFVGFKRAGEPEKIEGDKRTPAGVFRVGPSFGFSPLNEENYIWIKPGETGCVEDPDSPHYNTITSRSVVGGATRMDEMRRTPLYRNGLFIHYPTDRQNRRGSCIFIHIWSRPNDGTAGCIALPEHRVRAAQEFSRPGAVIAILSDSALDRFPNCFPPGSERDGNR